MESKAKLFGHAIHPIMIVFPFGLLTVALLFDILYFVTGNSSFAVVSFWNIAAGVVGGMLAAIFGFIDWQAIPNDTRAKAIGRWHGLCNGLVLVLFAVSWLIRLNSPDFTPGILAFLLVLAGGGVSLIAGWLGGELVERLGVGVDPGAHLNASSSLSGQPAHEHRRAGEERM
jgi:uncharacterized membrane protein